MVDGEDDDEHSGVGFVEITKIFATHGAYFTGTDPFEEIYNVRMIRKRLVQMEYVTIYVSTSI